MSDYGKASSGSFYLFLSQVIALIGGIAGLIIFSAYIEANLTHLENISNITSIYNFNTTGIPAYNASNLVAHMPIALIKDMLGAFIVLVVFGTAVGFTEILLMVYGWKKLSSFNNSDYHTPYIGSILSLIGFILIMSSAIFMLISVETSFVSLQTSHTLPPQLLAMTLTAAIPIFLGILMLLAGYIMVLLGYWRLGSQFRSSLIKAAIILLIISVVISLFSAFLPLIPQVLELISVILLTAGLYSVSKKAKLMEGQPIQSA
jgi:hypothetical protein